MWALSEISGYCYNFDLYCGKESDNDEHSNLLLVSKVVLKMLEAVEDP